MVGVSGEEACHAKRRCKLCTLHAGVPRVCNAGRGCRARAMRGSLYAHHAELPHEGVLRSLTQQRCHCVGAVCSQGWGGA